MLRDPNRHLTHIHLPLVCIFAGRPLVDPGRHSVDASLSVTSGEKFRFISVEATRDALVEELRPVQRRFRRERQEVERELAEAREALDRVEEADAQVVELVEELS